MDYEGKADVLFDQQRGMTIEIMDKNSGVQVIDIQIPPEVIVKMLSRQVGLPCSYTIRATDKIGKHEHIASMRVVLPSSTPYESREEVAKALSEVQCPANWVSDGYFGSRNSFFSKDGVDYATTLIRTYRNAPAEGYSLCYFDTETGALETFAENKSLRDLLKTDISELEGKGRDPVIGTTCGAYDGTLAMYEDGEWKMT